MRIILISVMIAMHRIVSIIIRTTIAHNRECISVLSPGLQKFAIMHNVSKLVNKYNKYEITCRILTGDSKFLAKFHVCRENIFPEGVSNICWYLLPEIGGHQLLFTFLLPRESPVCVHIVPLSPCLYPLSSAGLGPALSQHVAVQFPGPDCPATKMDY